MIIDIHTHTFPDAIAHKTIASMEEDIVRGQGIHVKCARIPTVKGLEDSTKKADIDLSVVCPVATNIRHVHAGEDVGLPETVHCTPDRILNLWKHIQPEKLILAHMGGWKMWDEVEDKLMGLPFYLDTAVVLNPIFPVKLENEQFVRMVRKHGADRILFGTDSPWYDQTKAVNDFNNTDLTQEEKDKIFGKNANDLFNFFGK